ncbi:MAG: UDP-N-acetylmuramate--L-alanine ligase [Lachnospiraceae bacterium]|nr:UDP-N-acetylmuramate--L-alanine ligase [Lachnospiraceae bacterium]
MQIDFNSPSHFYFIGIGGISMSGLAHILLDRGFSISGSDKKASEQTDVLSSLGASVFIGQAEENLEKAKELHGPVQAVIYTAAVKDDNEELLRARTEGIPCLTRATLLGQLMKEYNVSVAVSGTHGKTTTTSMLSQILLEGDTDPTLSIGGVFPPIHGNIRVGHSDTFVTEACEYTNSFLEFFPTIGIVLDIDADHLDFFKDLDDIRHSFRQFCALLPNDGTLIINADIEDVSYFTKGLSCNIITYGAADTCDYYPSDITFDDKGNPSYVLHRPDNTTQEIKLQVPGMHNVFNSVAACVAADLLQVERDIIARALSAFSGTHRRFEFKGDLHGVTIVDDYAHHPTEITATLTAAAKVPHNKIYTVFQPHTYTRTKALFDEFATALSLSDVVVLADIYAARETDTLGVSSKTLCDKMVLDGCDCHYFPTFDEIEKFLLKNCTKGDLLITMGAGDVVKIGDSLLGSA